ncbi:MAG TPA: hypothetical protein VKO18_17015 [Terriglobia bacterium]|nr:hypothetical protein [Terriglobia bacterium]
MAQTTDIHEHALPPAAPQKHESALRRAGSRIKLVVTRSIFWHYERGSWQYDLIVVAILCFIFLSPRAWFNDRPTLQLTDLRHQQGIVEMGRVNRDVRYLVDARLVESRDQKPEDAIPVILKEHLQRAFTVKSIDAVRDRHQVVLGYTVMVEE